jgi:hypothetical protein
MLKVCVNCKEEKLLNDFYKRKLSSDGHCSECKICSKQRNKDVWNNYYSKHKEKILEKNKAYNKDYRIRYKSRRNKLKINRYHTDIIFKLSSNLRGRITSAIKRNQKSGSAIKDLGCSITEFKQYIEDKFLPGMTWKNHGKWHLDHIRPISSFDLSDRKDFLKCAHYTNYQPLWAHDNLTKSSKIIL